jgi:hypothetical protein
MLEMAMISTAALQQAGSEAREGGKARSRAHVKFNPHFGMRAK